MSAPSRLSPTPQGGADAEVVVGVRSFPHLADHGFRDMAVLPGSFYVDLALSRYATRFGCTSATVRHATFQQPIILSNDDLRVAIGVTEHAAFVEYAFHERAADAASGGKAAGRCTACLEIHPPELQPLRTASDAWPVDAFQAAAQAVFDGERFYAALRANGNQYGPHYQHLSAIWRDRDRALALLTVPRRELEGDPRACRPLLLDAAIQLLSAFNLQRGQTFVLRSIERVDIADFPYPDRLWVQATWLPESDRQGAGSLGHVRVVDDMGRAYFELSGVRLAFLDRLEATGGQSAPQLCVAATFTAEPLADSLNFWADQFGTPVDLTFAPYNQIFQQLLDPASAFHENADGANVVLLALDDWAVDQLPVMRRLSETRARQCFGDRRRYVLPNGLDIVHLHQYETDHVYKEIFEDQCYARHGIRLRDDATVVDIGANIGLFSLFVLSRCARPRVLAFEPSPVVYDLLKANCDAYGSDVRAFNLGVAAIEGTATFTFYEHASVFSGFHADLAEDREAIHAVVRNRLTRDAGVGPEEVDAYVSELAAGRLRSKSFTCETTSVSAIIRAHDLGMIDLLKIDAEKSELDVLAGIDDEDWPRIQQIVIEVHDRTREKVGRVERLLTSKGYRCAIDQEPSLAGSGLFGVYATRREHEDSGDVAAPRDSDARCLTSLERSVDDFSGALRSFMSRSPVPLIIGFSPASPAFLAHPILSAALDAAEQRLTADVADIPHVHVIGSASLVARYQLDEHADPYSHQLGHMPYTSQGYAAIGTALFRLSFNLRRHPYKVIVLDCDNTLWKGVCGEDGPSGIEIIPAFRALQAFMVDQMNAGRLLCLCSKNNERDVLDVFEQRPDMALKDEHFVSRRLNWRSKSENLQSLARELNIGLESFVFVDDNPLECEEVRINCPTVLTLQLPENPDDIPSFLDRIWAFDHAGLTAEDRDRTRMYRENVAREQSRQRLSLGDFIKGLELQVAVTAPTPADLARISQLTFRTNQFNFTTIRRSELDVRDFLVEDHKAGLVVRVSDRFGDYGLTGVVLYEIRADRYDVETLLLSCRVLGKGVEHAVLAILAQRAAADGKAIVEIRYGLTAKNAPALEFLRSIAPLRRSASAGSWIFAAEDLAQLQYRPDHAPIADRSSADGPAGAVVPTAPMIRMGHISHSMQRLGTDLHGIGGIAKAIEYQRSRTLTPAPTSVEAGGTLEASLAGIWRRVLDRPEIGLHDNFFEAGGTSLSAVQLIATIRKELRHDVSIVHLFEYPTVARLAANLRAGSERPSAETAAGAALRGQQRRNRAVRRRTA